MYRRELELLMRILMNEKALNKQFYKRWFSIWKLRAIWRKRGRYILVFTAVFPHLHKTANYSTY